MSSYVVREEDGTSRITLEEGGGSVLLEESGLIVPRLRIVTAPLRWMVLVISFLTH